MNPTTAAAILKLLDIVVLGIQMAPKVKASYDASRAKIQTMIDEGRDPTEDEWNELLDEVQKNTDELNA